MKRPNPKLILSALLILLAWSILLNILQDRYIDRLITEIQDMEYVQQALSDHVNQLEQSEGADYGAE